MKSILACCAMLILGMALGIAIQRIPQIKGYTDTLIQPIETSDFVKQLKIKLGYQNAIASLTEPYPSLPYMPETARPEHPISSFIVHWSGYSLAYDAQHRNPAWVYEHLTAESVKDDENQPYSAFKEDLNIPEHLRTAAVDYRNRGLDRGQMAAAANYPSNAEAQSDTFYFTNICPQCPQLTEGYWPKFEQYVRDLTKDYAHVYVVTGPLYLPYQEKGGRFVKYRVIGPNDVAVPSHFFKVLILEDKQGKKERIAYILPNYEIPLDTPFEAFKTTVQSVEKAAGMIFP
jgi:endonuclease G